MLPELREALANTIQSGVPGSRVVAYPPMAINMPTSGVFAYVRPAEESDYLSRWLTFDPAIWITAMFEVVILVPDDSAERATRRLDELVDPMTDRPCFFGAIRNKPTLGITAFAVDAEGMFESTIRAYERVTYADSSVNYRQAIFPVAINVNTIGG